MSFKCSCQARVHVPVQVSNAGLMDACVVPLFADALPLLSAGVGGFRMQEVCITRSLEIVKDNFLLLGGLVVVKIRWRGKALASMLRWDTSEVPAQVIQVNTVLT